ncbi:ABC transporter ATP-binding protein [Halomonas sp.]|jgi:branched-chain amino acid transport system ATP-binding protein|uniref:ABC transporter ATP-binding protein n=1 Tax=Vreelandella TaxID=3137766 RepID=UPI000E88059B|nr:ABC transporter ATP-binding protein [Halomonas sp.]HBM44361.1 ABC transporter ATP-binding protein [Halomonas sp.]|tara:strand:+ start:808 stop:1539 length:732 start_codon:yes stop_codon:yes gene_type:complete
MTTNATETPLIDARGLHTYYGESHVLHGVDLTLMPGETLSLLGRNGMGKTTTLKSILGFVPPRRGEVFIKGVSTAKRRPWQLMRQGIGYVPEGRGIFPGISVREHLIMAARPNERGETPWTMERVLDTFPRLGQRINHDGALLSGGEQQMLSIGRALTTNPDLMILDEATEGLAPLIRDEIWKIIRTIKATGISTIIVDKNIDNLLEVAEKQLLLVKGEVMYSGDSQGLKDNPALLETHLGVA